MTLETIIGIVKEPSTIIGLLKNPAVDVIAVIALSIICVGVILVYVTKSITPLTPFLYANAIIQARSSRLISSNRIKELAEIKSLSELGNSLRDSDYSEELERMDKIDLRMVHIAIERGFVKSIIHLKETSPKKFVSVVEAYLMFLEANVLETIYRAKFFNNKVEEGLVFDVGNITPIILKHLMEAESISDMGVVMSTTIYQQVFSKKHESIEEFDVALEEFILNRFIETTQQTKVYEAEYIVDIINKKVDILNLLALIKFRIRGMDKEKQIKFLVNNNAPLTGRFREIIFADNFMGFVDAINGLPYHNALTKAMSLYEKDGDIFHFENELQRFFKEQVSDLEMAHTLGPYPLISYLVKKEIEKRNLFIVSKGIESGFGAARIREMVV